jgi:hypothetical protein
VDKVGNRQPGKPFLIGRNNMPGCPLGAGVGKRIFISFSVVIPVAPLFRIANGKFPIFPPETNNLVYEFAINSNKDGVTLSF